MTTTEGITEALAPLGRARLDDQAFTDLVRTITGRPDAKPASVRIEPVDYEIGTPSTEGLLRLRGTAELAGGDIVDWSCFVKRLQSPKWWDKLHLVPEEVREHFIATIPWRLEIAAHTNGMASLLPDGLRLPTAYRLDEYDDDRATIWMENVKETSDPWDLNRFERSAYLLGRLAARRQPHLVGPIMRRPGVDTPGAVLRYYTNGRVQLAALPAIADEQTWQHPLLKAAVCNTREHNLQAELLALGARLPAVLDSLDALPQTYQHGDASPQNLLVPADKPDEFVVIDWGFDCPQAVGFDLGQLLVGLAHAGALEPEDLPAIHAVIVKAYTEGLHADGMTVPQEAVQYGYLGSMLARATFTTLPLEAFGAEPSDELARLFDQRVRLTRTLVDLVSGIN
jgi:hypothetical protein